MAEMNRQNSILAKQKNDIALREKEIAGQKDLISNQESPDQSTDKRN